MAQVKLIYRWKKWNPVSFLTLLATRYISYMFTHTLSLSLSLSSFSFWLGWKWACTILIARKISIVFETKNKHTGLIFHMCRNDWATSLRYVALHWCYLLSYPVLSWFPYYVFPMPYESRLLGIINMCLIIKNNIIVIYW